MEIGDKGDEGTRPPAESNGLRPGYGWAVGASGFALLSGILGWLSVVLSHRIHRTSTNIVWQATLAGTIAVAAVALLLAFGAWRRRGGVGVARVAAAIAAASVVASPIAVVLERPSVPYVRISAFRAADGSPQWTSSPHLIEAYTISAGSSRTVAIGGISASGLCYGNPSQATVSTVNGKTMSLVPINPSSAPADAFGLSVTGFGGLSAVRAPDAKVDVSVNYESPTNGTPQAVLQATDIATGTLRWQVPISSPSLGPVPISPLWVDGQVVIAASSTNPNSGVFEGGILNQSSPSIAGSSPLSLGSGRTVIALDARTGREKWRATFDSVDQPVAVAAGAAGVAVATSTSLELRSLGTGAVVASTRLSGGILASTSVETGSSTTPLVVDNDTVVVLMAHSDLAAFGPSLSPRWVHHLAIHHDIAALQLEAVGNLIYVIDQEADPTSGC